MGYLSDYQNNLNDLEFGFYCGKQACYRVFFVFFAPVDSPLLKGTWKSNEKRERKDAWTRVGSYALFSILWSAKQGMRRIFLCFARLKTVGNLTLQTNPALPCEIT